MGKLPFAIALALVALVFSFGHNAFAQGTTSRVTGTITDANGAAVAGATVTLTNEGTNVSITAQSSSEGFYTFDLIQPGIYSVVVEKQGFKRFVSTNNRVLVNQPATLSPVLEVGDIQTSVTVESTVEQVQTNSSGNIGNTIEQQTLESLPIVGTRGRNPLDLLNYQPGVVTGGNTGGLVHVNGSRDRSFNFTLDGIDINESSAGGSNFTPLRTNPDSLQEFQVVTSGFTAELGRSSGAQVTLVTRSGTNGFHGNVFEYYQTPEFLARSYAANTAGSAKEQFVQHIFGGSLGGPIIKDRLWFFTNIQLLRAYDSLLTNRTVYTATARQGIYRWVRGSSNSTSQVDTAGNPIRPACSATVTTLCIDSYDIVARTGITLDPLLMGYIRAMPLPNNFREGGDGLNTATFSFNAPQNEKQYDFVTKFDYKLNDQNNFYVRYAQGEQNTFGDSVNGGRRSFPDTPNIVDTFRYPKNLAVNWRFSPTAKFTNEFIIGLNKFGFDFVTPEPDPNYIFVFQLPRDTNTNFSYNARRLRTWQFVDNMTFDLSPHVVKAGVNLRLGRQVDDRASQGAFTIEGQLGFSRADNASSIPSAWGTQALTGAPAADRNRLEQMINDMLGRIGSYSRLFVIDPANPSQFAPAGTRWAFTADYPELDFYVQDTWKFLPNLTFDLGVRWEVKLSPSSAGALPILRPNQPFTLGSPPSNNLRWEEGKLFDDDYGLFMPSVGFAWDPFSSGKTSIRANYRMASDKFGTQLFAASIWPSTPGNIFQGATTLYGQQGRLLRDGLPPIAPTASPSALRTPPPFSTASINVIDPDLKFPRIHSWTLSFQRELFKDNVLEINYIGKRAHNLFGAYNANQVRLNGTLPGVSGNFLSEFNAMRGSTSYNSPLINLLFTGDPNNNGGTARFRALNSTGITQGSAASLALAASQKVCVAADVTAGLCTNAQLGQRILDIRGFSSFFQPFSQYTGGLIVIDSNDFSFYNGLEFTFKRRIRNGLGFQFSYTRAVSKDTRSFDPVFTTISTVFTAQSAGSTPFDNNDRRLNYSWSDFDRRNVFVGTYVWELPFGRGKWIGGGIPRPLDWVVGGWQLAGAVRYMSGRPFTVYSGLFTVSQSVGSTANCNGCPRNLGSVVQGDFTTPAEGRLRNWFFDSNARSMFSQPGPGQQGNTPRNYFIGPSFFEMDASLAKKFRFTERISFDLRVDAKNVLNRPNFNIPSAVLPADITTLGNNIFGRINADVVNSARRIQLAGKINF
jgi:hypothetical protein